MMARSNVGSDRRQRARDATSRSRRAAKIGGSILLVTAGAGLAPGGVLASTGPAPDVVPSVPITPEPWWLIPGAFAMTLVAAIVVAITRPSSRRRLAAAAVFVAFALVGAFFVLGGFFSDFSGQHRVAWPVVGIGAVIGVVGLLASAAVAGRFSKRPEST